MYDRYAAKENKKNKKNFETSRILYMTQALHSTIKSENS